MGKTIRTNAASSGVKLDGRQIKALSAKSDRPGLIYLAKWVVLLGLSGSAVWLTLGSWLMWPLMFVHGVILCVPAYSASHETAHGTAFKSKWLNETVLWITSFIYMEEPLHRRYTHTNHHSFTWHVGKDSQMPFDTPMGFGGWLQEITGIGLARFHTHVFFQLALRRYTDTMRMACPESVFGKMTRNARIMIALYALIAIAPAYGIWWPIWLFVLPRLLGAPIMLLFTLTQHVELQENSPSILESTRSFHTGAVAKFLYMNMNHHVEHHLYPQVPFYALPQLADAVKDQVPEPDPGFFKTNMEVLRVVIRRSLGLSTRSHSIRQASHMISDGGPYEKIAHRTM
ncbi:fatty acid desaturase [Phaeobacter sp.]|uniref:fatty acid desaturase n=1 Tax=Phaeobacter sp. TaxID=1902409 RepID=UPI0025F0184A|nr:fatty acid desaturase [Phaeobacter sp.]